MSLRAALDTNVVIASGKSASVTSPSRKIIGRFQASEFTLLYSRDVISEYLLKFSALGIDLDRARDFLLSLSILGEQVSIEFFHELVYPSDQDDLACWLCALNGRATISGEA